MNIGLISDTHGLLRPEALDALRGASHILHAGDIGKPEILEGLESVAPVAAVRGNNDTAAWAKDVPETRRIEFGKTRIYMLHDLKELEIDPAQEGYDVVIAGHSHKPEIESRNGVLYVNPGSAGPRRFSLPVSVGMLTLDKGDVNARIIELDVPPPRRRREKK